MDKLKTCLEFSSDFYRKEHTEHILKMKFAK